MNNTVVKKRKRKKFNSKKIIIVMLSLAVLFAAHAVIIHLTTRVTNESYAKCAVGVSTETERSIPPTRFV